MKHCLLLFCLMAFLGCTPCKDCEKKFDPKSDAARLATKGFPKRKGFVNDYQNILTAAETAELEQIISGFNAKTGNEIVIAIVDGVYPYFGINGYATGLSDYWGVGRDGNGGLSIVLSLQLHKVQVSTSCSTSKNIDKTESQQIVDQVLVPSFRDKKFFAGFKAALQEIIAKWG
jgi:uncharacterized protein